ncbi:MAG: type II toxin-antitoxin system Phd/YefM family antitoxin [Candidatus Odinarchaeota archaeon]|nr:type II toxin-antitoxin system Phd/YefM family antitoxin [Candidatus Odinarchaeota archaeon]
MQSDSDKEQFIVDEKGKKIAVIIPIKKYRRILEDIHDLTVVSEREKEENVDFEEVKRRLRERGII